MTTVFAPTALLPDGWAGNVLIEVDRDGWIVGIDSFKTAAGGKDVDIVSGALVPGMSNAHSHAFQRAMAGLTERAGGKKDNFWSWRETMYRFLQDLTPEDMEAIASQVYVEMLKGGYTSVGEFHYIHHSREGAPYEDRALMSKQVIKAALETGIAITHLPVLYAYSGFDAQPPADAQKRFVNTVPEMMKIIEALRAEYAHVPQVTLGFAHHSLRAVSPEMLREGTRAARQLLPQAPIHIHAAEQLTEVENCLNWSGKRPVEWLLEEGNVDEHWSFVHCTHLVEQELEALASSGVVVALCPTTEANLGDGVFPLVPFFEAGGRFAIGSDSHISLNLMEELRWLEYVQRLVLRERTLVKEVENPSVGAVLFEQTLSGGAHALGRRTGKIEVGHRADFLVLDLDLPCMTGKVRDHILDTAIFATNENPVKDVMAGGRWVIRDRRHKREEHILARYRETVKKFK